MKEKFIVTFIIIGKLENSKVKKNNGLLTLLFLVLSIEIILPGYAKIGIAAGKKNQ